MVSSTRKCRIFSTFVGATFGALLKCCISTCKCCHYSGTYKCWLSATFQHFISLSDRDSLSAARGVNHEDTRAGVLRIFGTGAGNSNFDDDLANVWLSFATTAANFVIDSLGAFTVHLRLVSEGIHKLP